MPRKKSVNCMLGLWVLVFLFASSSCFKQVQPSCGPIKGIQTQFATAYYGIPYGQAPTGSLRFQPSQPANCWNGTLNATKPQFVCFSVHPTTLTQTEDCLNLDVYVPKTFSGKQLPVLFWIYGGSNIAGYSTSYPNLDYLANELEVILVSPNYRLGTLGYLALRELSKRDIRGVSGNYGITDLILALQWTKSEISSFGGNPNSVTLIGQSSGGTNIFALMASPIAQNLFNGAISLSGSPNITMSMKQAEQQHEDLLLPGLGCPPEIVQCLLDLDPRTLTDRLPIAFQEDSGYPIKKDGMNFAGLVIADGVTVKSILDTVKNPNNDTGKSILFQVTQGEIFPLFPVSYINELSAGRYRKWIDEMYSRDNGWKAEVPKKINELYRKEMDSHRGAFIAWSTFTSDVFFFGGNAELANQAGSNWLKSNIFIGYVDYDPSTVFCILNPLIPSPIAFHLWDYILATNSWNFISKQFGGECGDFPFQPQRSDFEVGKAIRGQWKALIYNGTFAGSGIGWEKVEKGRTNIGVIGGTQVENVLIGDLRNGVLNVLQEQPIGLNAPEFWFVN